MKRSAGRVLYAVLTAIAGAAVATTILVAVAPRSSVGNLHTSGQPLDSCKGIVIGGRAAVPVPDYLLWESFFSGLERAEATPLRGVLSAATLETVKQIGKSAKAKSQAIRTSNTTQTHSAERLAAEAILQGRDELIRTMPPNVYELIDHAAQTDSRERIFRLSKIGALKRNAGGVVKCHIAVKGRDYPHLIPEAVYWEFYFNNRAEAAHQYRRPDDLIDDEHVEALRRTQLPVASEYVQQVLAASNRVHVKVAAARQNGASELDVAEIVLSARADLLRAFPASVWKAVSRDALRICNGANFFYDVDF